MTLKVAFATDDKKNLVNKHFGDAEFYLIYEISKDEINFVEKRQNTSTEEDERFHGDPKKANKMGTIMKGVQVLCNKQFGKNITRMSKNFVPVIFNIDNIDEAIKIIQNNFEQVEKAWNDGENRKHLSFRNSK